MTDNSYSYYYKLHDSPVCPSMLSVHETLCCTLLMTPLWFTPGSTTMALVTIQPSSEFGVSEIQGPGPWSWRQAAKTGSNAML